MVSNQDDFMEIVALKDSTQKKENSYLKKKARYCPMYVKWLSMNVETINIFVTMYTRFVLNPSISLAKL